MCKADTTFPNLDFSSTSTISLVKSKSDIDAIGNQFLSENVPSADIISIINDPTGVSDYGIDTKYIGGFRLRRSSLVKDGVLSQTVAELIDTWGVDVAGDMTDLGYHNCACQAPVLSWADHDQLTPEAQRAEGAFGNDEGVIVLSEASTSNAQIQLGREFWEFRMPSANDLASSIIDYEEDFNPNVFITIPAGNTSVTVPMIGIVYGDGIEEGNEGVGYRIFEGGQNNITVDPVKGLWDYLIFEPVSSTRNVLADGSVSLFPSVLTAGSDFQLEIFDTSIELKSYTLVS